jgi:hypothetical protein
VVTVLVVFAGVNLVIAGFLLGRVWVGANDLPLPQVVGDAVPVVLGGQPVNFTVPGKVAGDDQAGLVRDLEVVRTGGDPRLRAQIALDETGASWGGWMFTRGYFPTPGAPGRLDWGAHRNCGYDLSGATALTVVARGSQGGEQIEFFTAGQAYDPVSGKTVARWADSTNKIRQIVTLTDQFETYTIPLEGFDLSYIGNGFGFTIAADSNSGAEMVVVEFTSVRFELPDAAARIAARQQADNAKQRFDIGTGTATVIAALIAGIASIIVARLTPRAQPEPTKSDPAQSEPSQPEPVKPDPVQPEPVKPRAKARRSA